MLFEYLMYRSATAEINSARNAAAASASNANQAMQRARELDDRFQRLALATQAMWSLLQEKFQLTDQELKEKITQLDLADGKLDGKMRHTPSPCPKCSRMNAPRMERCLYCSEPLPKQPFA